MDMRTQADLEDELAAYRALERAEIDESNLALVMDRWPDLSRQAACMALLIYSGGRRGVSKTYLIANIPGRNPWSQEERSEKIIDVILHRLRSALGRLCVKTINGRYVMAEDWQARFKRLTS